MCPCDEYKALLEQCQYELRQAKEYIVLLENKLLISGNKQAVLEGEIQGFRDSSDVKETADRILQHDLRGALVASASLPRILLDNEELSDAQREILTMIQNSGKSMLEILDSSIGLYRLEEGKYIFIPESVNILDLLESTISRLEHSGAICKNEIIIQKLDISVFVSGDVQLLHRAFFNILLNALEASPCNAPIYISINRNEYCDIEIRNSGEVPVEIRNIFFDKFVTQGKKQGTGLGTYSAKLMIEAQHGNISVDSSEPGVTRVIVSLPIAEV